MTGRQLSGDAKSPSAILDRDRPPGAATNGEVHGSGSGAGGGNPGEDCDHDPVGGDGDLTDNPEVNDGLEDQIHQAVENQSSVTPDDYPEKNGMPVDKS